MSIGCTTWPRIAKNQILRVIPYWQFDAQQIDTNPRREIVHVINLYQSINQSLILRQEASPRSYCNKTEFISQTAHNIVILLRLSFCVTSAVTGNETRREHAGPGKWLTKSQGWKMMNQIMLPLVEYVLIHSTTNSYQAVCVFNRNST